VPVETDYLQDFTGGEQDAISSLEYDETNWMTLFGFVFDNNDRIRSQWAGAEWDVRLPEGS
jgi:hypothetical protein